jgi:hypothetical protein
LSSTPFAGFAQSSSWSSTPQQSAFGQSPFSTSLGPTPSAAFAQPSSSSSGQATAPLILKLTRKASKNLPGQRLANRAKTLKQGETAEDARRKRVELQEYLRKQQRQSTVNKLRQGVRQGAIPGGRRRTQKNHKRKKHGTQRK